LIFIAYQARMHLGIAKCMAFDEQGQYKQAEAHYEDWLNSQWTG
jgi:hypothetical protein